MRLNKIPLEQFINLLEEIYQSGANFVDIEGYPEANDSGDLKDIIKLIIRPEYLMDDDEEDDVNITHEEEAPSKLSEDDINELI